MGGNSDKKMRFSVRDDGIYIIINVGSVSEKPLKNEIIKAIEDAQLSEINFNALNEVFESNSLNIEKKITDNKKIAVKNEVMIVEVSRDKMRAFIRFEPPAFGGEMLTPEKIEKDIEQAGVKEGIDRKMLDAIFVNRNYSETYEIARGREAVDGKDGKLNYLVGLNERSHAPKELDDGSVDFKQVFYFESVVAGQKLVEGVHPLEGKNGLNVLGQEVNAKLGRPLPPMPKGKNTSIVGDNEALVADISGKIEIESKRININPVLEIAGNVNYETGNVDFNGSVIIRGGVNAGFSVSATGQIEIHGIVESCFIKSLSDINILGGVQGGGVAEINAGRNLVIKFAENANLTAGKDIITDSILHSNVKCGGSILLSGKKCVLVGGKFNVGGSIKAKTIGSPMSTYMEISVGHPPELLESYNAAKKELDNLINDFKKIESLVNALSKISKETLTPEKKELLLKSLHSKAYYRNKIIEFQQKIKDEIMPTLESGRGTIEASNVIRSGIKVVIGDAVLYVRDDIINSKLKYSDGRIEIVPL